MSGLVAWIGLPEIVAGLMLVALNAYVLTGGADFGGGMWDLLARGPRREEQRALIGDAIAPIWEANHVWLIVVVVVLFTAFPSGYAGLATVLHIPLSIFLIGIVLRGSAFIFRSYGGHDERGRRRWGLIFSIASTIAPVLLGVIVGALSSGAVGAALGRIGYASFADVFVWPWLGPYPIAVGAFALALFAFLAAVYLALKAERRDLREDFRRRALSSGLVVFVLAALALLLSRTEAPRVAAGVMGAPWSMALHLCTAVAAIGALLALWMRRYRVARVAAATQVTLILWGWALAQYPFIIPTTVTIRDGAAPGATLRLLLLGLAAGAAILLPSLVYLFRVFGDGPAKARH